MYGLRTSGRFSWRVLVRAAVLSWPLAAAFAAGAQGKPVPLRSGAVKCDNADQAPHAVRCSAVKVDLASLSPETSQLSLALPGKDPLVFARRRSASASQGFVWDGKGARRARATFSVVNKAIVGDIFAPDDKVFRLRYAWTGRYIVGELDLSKLEKMEPTPAAPEPLPAPPTPACTTDSPNRVDVMILYTPPPLRRTRQRIT